MKYHSNFNHDFANSLNNEPALKASSSPIKKLSLFSVLLLLSLTVLFITFSNIGAQENTAKQAEKLLTSDIKIQPIKAKKEPFKQLVLTSEKTQDNKQDVNIIHPIIKSENKQPNHNHTITYRVKSGDSLALIFKKHGLSKQLLHKIIYSSEHGKQLAHIKPKQTITFILNANKDLESITLQKNKIESLSIKQEVKGNQNQFISFISKKEIEKRQKFVTVDIKGSLFLSATKAGLSENFTMELAQLFGWDIDFALDIRNGDSFSVLFNEHYVEGKKIANGQILVAEFINQGKSYQSIYFTDKSGKSDYYNREGYSKRKAFLRTPVAFSRISSRFSMGRRHPVLNKIRAHKGVDYASPRGTPIKSAGDGKISFKGRKGGYGRVVQIKHGSKYMTVYAHMSSFAKSIKRGSKVKQGQIIGYVGSSGLATGPHLHYEFRVNGVHRNPLKVTLPKANPINKNYLPSFLAHSENMISSLKLSKHKQIALLKP